MNRPLKKQTKKHHSKKHTPEWVMVCCLYPFRGDMNDEQRMFIECLHNNLDPYEPFLDQMIGLKGGDKQQRWLKWLFNKYLNNDKQDLDW